MCSRTVELGIDSMERRGVSAGNIIHNKAVNARRAGGGTEPHSESFTSVPKTNQNNPRDSDSYYFQEQHRKPKHGTPKGTVKGH